jgi:thymidylate synthase
MSWKLNSCAAQYDTLENQDVHYDHSRQQFGVLNSQTVHSVASVTSFLLWFWQSTEEHAACTTSSLKLRPEESILWITSKKKLGY